MDAILRLPERLVASQTAPTLHDFYTMYDLPPSDPYYRRRLSEKSVVEIMDEAVVAIPSQVIGGGRPMNDALNTS